MEIVIINLGMVQYDKALMIQNLVVKNRKSKRIGNILLLLEHPPVITMGIRGTDDHIYASEEYLNGQGIKIIKVNRGGAVTYHGPGQIVGYPIFDMNDFNRDVAQFVRNIEYAIIGLLKDKYGIDANYETGKYTGVWVGGKKIAAIGIAIVKAITMHGFAFNVNTNLEHFKLINPCGLSKGVTSVEELTGKKADMKELFDDIADYFVKAFHGTPRHAELSEFLDDEDISEIESACIETMSKNL